MKSGDPGSGDVYRAGISVSESDSESSIRIAVALLAPALWCGQWKFTLSTMARLVTYLLPPTAS